LIFRDNAAAQLLFNPRALFNILLTVAHRGGERNHCRAVALHGSLAVQGVCNMARYSRGASKSVKSAISRRKRGTLKSGRTAKKVKSRKQAVAIGLTPARRKRKKVPKRGSR
jgi:hypothetical protein